MNNAVGTQNIGTTNQSLSGTGYKIRVDQVEEAAHNELPHISYLIWIFVLYIFNMI